MEVGRVAGPQRFVWALLCVGLVLGMSAQLNSAEARHWHTRHHHPVRHHRVLRINHRSVRHARARRATSRHHSTKFAALVVDANTGRTLYAVHENALRHPASLTKVMTLYLLFEQLAKGKLHLDSRIPISAHAASMPPTKLGLPAGSTITIRNAIKAIVTQSANDIAVAIAEALGGTESHFARLMTEKAHALGMTRTHYANASGLPNDRQLTTAHDLAVLGEAIQRRFPQYFHYFSLRKFRFAGRTMYNHNHLLGRVRGMDGIKTGYIRASGFNLLTDVRRGGRHIISVVLGGSTAASRDRIMAGLIKQHIAQAADGRPRRRVAASRSEHRGGRAGLAKSDRRPRPAYVSGMPRSASRDLSVTGSISAKKRRALEGSTSASAQVASARSHRLSTQTPTILRWIVGPPGKILRSTTAPAAASGETRVAKGEADRHLPSHPGVMIQIGATDDVEKADALLARARKKNRSVLVAAQAFTEKVHKGDATLYRARFAGFDRDHAEAACEVLKRSGFACFTTRH